MPASIVPADASVRLLPGSRADPDLADVLDGQLGTDGLRALVDPGQHDVTDLLRSCVRRAEQVTDPVLLRTKYKPGRKLTAYYRLQLGPEVRPVAVTWLAAPPPDGDGAGPDQAIPRGLVEPFVRLGARSENGQVSLQIAPLDPQLPQLVRLSDHAHLARTLASLDTREPARSKTSDPRWFEMEAVRYRPGQRHVLRITPGRAPHPQADATAVYLKIDRDNRGARAVRFADEVGPLLTGRTPTAHLVQPLGYAAADQAAVWREVAGATLSAEVGDPARAAPAFALLGRAIRTLHELDPTAATSESAEESVAPSAVRTELVSTLGAGAHVTALLPTVGARFRRLAAEAVERLECLPAEEPRLGHGDLKCDNLIAAGGRIWLLDLDRAGLAEPAMDLSKLLADVAWWGRAHSVDVRGAIEAFLDGYGPCDPIRLTRARLVAVLYRLKLAARRTPVHAPDWDVQVTRQVDEAAARLDQEAHS